MRLTVSQFLAFTLFFSCSLARSLHESMHLARRDHSAIANRSEFNGEDADDLTKRGTPKYVFMHHVSSIPQILHVHI